MSQQIDLLFVEDDPDFRETLVRRFRRRGFHAEAAESAENALELVQRRQFDVAVLDMMLPGMSGLDLMKKLKSAQAECETIVLTGQGTIESAVDGSVIGTMPTGFYADWSLDDSTFARLTFDGQIEVYRF